MIKIVNISLPERLLIKRLIKVVAQYYEVSEEDIVSGGRHGIYMTPKKVLIYLTKNVAKINKPYAVAKILKVSRTTVMHHWESMEDLLKIDSETKHEYEEVKALAEAAMVTPNNTNSKIIIDTKNGSVHLFKNGKKITPEDSPELSMLKDRLLLYSMFI